MVEVNKILVTGGAGFIGSHVAEHFAKQGCQVIALDNLSRRRARDNVEYLHGVRNVKFVRGDTRDFRRLRTVASGVDAIIHTAGQVAVTSSVSDSRLDFEINSIGTFNALEVARLNDASFIFCSTNKVYGTNVNKIPTKETETRYAFGSTSSSKGIPEDFPVDLCQHTPYGCSKLAGDLYTQEYHHTYGLNTAVFRMSCIYGDRQFGTEDQGWVAWFTIASVLGRSITIYGDGKQVRDILFISDLVRAFRAFLERESEAAGEVFNIGGGPNNTISLLELLESLGRATRRPSLPSFSAWRPADQKVYVSNISKAKEKLRWHPRISTSAGVKTLLNWVSRNRRLFA